MQLKNQWTSSSNRYFFMSRHVWALLCVQCLSLASALGHSLSHLPSPTIPVTTYSFFPFLSPFPSPHNQRMRFYRALSWVLFYSTLSLKTWLQLQFCSWPIDFIFPVFENSGPNNSSSNIFNWINHKYYKPNTSKVNSSFPFSPNTIYFLKFSFLPNFPTIHPIR